MSIEVRAELPGRGNVRDTPVDWNAVRALMVENQGMWVKVAENVAGSTATQLNAGRNKHFRDADLDQFEFAVRKPEDAEKAATYGPKRTDLWGRYTAPKTKKVTS
jgi:hypothetical protein